MPSALTYPGVYVEEIPSGVRTITGVATSITAFIGRTLRGPVNKATVINSYGDFEKLFGGLWIDSALSYSLRDFFLNGGGQAIVIRLYHDDPGNPAANPPVPAPQTAADLSVGALKFVAASQGKWGTNLRVTVDQDNIKDEAATALGLAKADLFNLTVRDTSPGGRTEKFVNVSAKESARRIDRVLTAESELLAYREADVATVTSAAVAPGADALSVKEKDYGDKKKARIEKENTGDPATAEKAAEATAKTALDAELKKAAGAVGDGLPLSIADFLPASGETDKKGLYALEQSDLFNLLCIPPYRSTVDPIDVDVNLIASAAAYCEKRRAMLIVDSPKNWKTKSTAVSEMNGSDEKVGTRSRNAAIFFPRLVQSNPLRDGQQEVFAACGAVAGIFARTDTTRGVWKAPAGLDATLVGVPALSVSLTDAENGELNPLGVNCLRAFAASGRVVWGSRTLRGNDQLADEYKYIPVRRTALYIEESLFRGLKWVVFEPNDEPLWSQIRLNVGAFLHTMFRQGAFQGTSPREAYFVKCDKETTTQTDINLGIVNVVVGFAPLKPAEFVVIKLQQIAGQIEV